MEPWLRLKLNRALEIQIFLPQNLSPNTFWFCFVVFFCFFLFFLFFFSARGPRVLSTCTEKSVRNFMPIKTVQFSNTFLFAWKKQLFQWEIRWNSLKKDYGTSVMKQMVQWYSKDSNTNETGRMPSGRCFFLWKISHLISHHSNWFFMQMAVHLGLQTSQSSYLI